MEVQLFDPPHFKHKELFFIFKKIEKKSREFNCEQFYHYEQFKSANQSSSSVLLEAVQVGLRGKCRWWLEVVQDY
jgi:hypothetical protein